jgi:glutamyl-tRNA reductase
MEIKVKENSFQTISLSHRNAPISIREKMVFDETETKNFLLHLRDLAGIYEAFLLSTCNRTEVYFHHSAPHEGVIKALASFKGISAEALLPYLSVFEKTEDSVRHLFRVGVGLESQVLGDLQITNQVKNAYQWCADMNMAGPFLHRVLHALFFANKKIVQTTSFRSGSASVSYATKELAEDLLTDKNQAIVLLGLGEIGLATARNLAENGFTNLTICNRTYEKVKPLEEEFGIVYSPFENWKNLVLQSRLVISSLSGKVIQIGKKEINPTKSFGFQYFIDLGMPRSILPEVEEHSHVILYNLDQIQSKVSEALEMRQNAISEVEEILNQAMIEFLDWTKEMVVSPVIHQMKGALEQIRQEEMARFLKKADEEQAAWADELTKNFMQRIMKTHVVQLKAACRRGDAESLVEVLQQLFTVDQTIEA